MSQRLLPITFSFAALLTALLPAQDALTSLSLAEEALNAGRREESLLQLMAARQLLATAPDGAATKVVNATLESLEAKADIALDQRQAAVTAAAKQLLKLARAYKGRRWQSMAVHYAEFAERLDPEVAERELKQLRKQTGAKAKGRKGSPSKAAGKAEKAAGIGALGRGVVLDEWKLVDGTLLSPSPPPTSYSPYYLTSTEHKDELLSVAIDVGNRDAMAGMIFGANDATDYFILDMMTFADSGRVSLRLYYYKEPGLQLLTEGEVDLGAPTTLERRLAVCVRGAQIEGFVDGKRGILCDGPRLAHGLVGFYVSAASARKEGAVPFHDFLREPAPEQGAASAEAVTADAESGRALTLTKIALAEQDLEDKRPEAAVRKLLEARRSSYQLKAGVMRKVLLDSIDELLKADPLRVRRAKAEAEAAKILAELANTYGKQDWPRVALSFALLAGELDPAEHLPLVKTYAAQAEALKSR